MKKDGPSYSKIHFIFIVLLTMVIACSCLAFHHYTVYNSIEVVGLESPSIEYGSANYNIHDFIKKVEGKIVSIQDNIDTSVVGEQEVILNIEKDNVKKSIPFTVSVVDTTAPVIELKEDKVTITSGDDYDLTYNVSSVRDDVDGDIYYNGEVNEDSLLYYNFSYDQASIDNVGEHEVIVQAKDKNGNVSSSSFILEVKERPIVYRTYTNAGVNPNGSDVVSIAYSLVGSPYIGGSNGPYGFDCSGFVQYVYSRVGVSVSRSSYTQIYDGVGVSYENAAPGDILSWGYSNGTVTHSALYIGNGQMIHAANPSQGVIVSDVSYWLRGSGTQILSVRRIS